jgi:hypothetical protein
LIHDLRNLRHDFMRTRFELRCARPPVTSLPQVSTQIESLQPLEPIPTFSRPSPPPASPKSGRPRRPLWPKGHIARFHVIPGPFAQTRGITVSISIFPKHCIVVASGFRTLVLSQDSLNQSTSKALHCGGPSYEG